MTVDTAHLTEVAAANPTLTHSLADLDPAVHQAIAAELERQQGTLEMIASENFAPLAVMQAQGSVLTNKYAEATPDAATTADASTSTSSSSSPSTASPHCSVRNSPTCNRTPERRPTPPRCRHC